MSDVSNKVVSGASIPALREWIKSKFVAKEIINKGYISQDNLVTDEGEPLMTSADENIVGGASVFSVCKPAIRTYLKHLGLI